VAENSLHATLAYETSRRWERNHSR